MGGCGSLRDEGLDEATLREALRLASHKLPIKCKIIGKGE